jgi:hypothetical protein
VLTATFRQIRVALAQAINAGTDLRTYSTDIDQIAVPCAVVSRAEYDPRFVFGATSHMAPFKVRVFVNRTAERSALELLDEYADPNGNRSVIAAVQDEDLWPFDLQSAQVVLVSETREAAWAGGGESYFMVEFDVEVVW